MNTIKIVSAVLLIGVQLITPIIGQFSQAVGQASAGTDQNNPYGYYGQTPYGQSQGTQASATAVSTTVQNTQPGYYGPNQFTQSYYQPGYSGLSIYPQPCNNGPFNNECLLGNIIFLTTLYAQRCQDSSYQQPIGYPEGFQQEITPVSFAPAQNQQFAVQPIGYQQGATSASYALAQTQSSNNYYQQQPNFYQQPQYYQPQPQYFQQQPQYYQQTPYNSPQTSYTSSANNYGFSYGNADPNSGGSAGAFAASDSNTYIDTTNPDGSEAFQHNSDFALTSANANSDPSSASASGFALTGSHSYTDIEPANN